MWHTKIEGSRVRFMHIGLICTDNLFALLFQGAVSRNFEGNASYGA